MWGVQVRSDLCAESSVGRLLAWVYKGLSRRWVQMRGPGGCLRDACWHRRDCLQ